MKLLAYARRSGVFGMKFFAYPSYSQLYQLHSYCLGRVPYRYPLGQKSVGPRQDGKNPTKAHYTSIFKNVANAWRSFFSTHFLIPNINFTDISHIIYI